MPIQRRLVSVTVDESVFTWVLQRLADAGLVRGKTVGIDATTLEANTALRRIRPARHGRGRRVPSWRGSTGPGTRRR